MSGTGNRLQGGTMNVVRKLRPGKCSAKVWASSVRASSWPLLPSGDPAFPLQKQSSGENNVRSISTSFPEKDAMMGKDLRGHVLDIQRYTLHDGPGIRTGVFLQGCPLRCLWCHSQESCSKTGELAWLHILCVGVEKCGEIHQRSDRSEDNG